MTGARAFDELRQRSERCAFGRPRRTGDLAGNTCPTPGPWVRYTPFSGGGPGQRGAAVIHIKPAHPLID